MIRSEKEVRKKIRELKKTASYESYAEWKSGIRFGLEWVLGANGGDVLGN